MHSLLYLGAQQSSFTSPKSRLIETNNYFIPENLWSPLAANQTFMNRFSNSNCKFICTPFHKPEDFKAMLRSSEQIFLLLCRCINMHVELFNGIHKEYSACAVRKPGYSARFQDVISSCFTAIEFGVNLQTAAITVKQPAEIQTNLKPKLYASKRPPTPAPII